MFNINNIIIGGFLVFTSNLWADVSDYKYQQQTLSTYINDDLNLTYDRYGLDLNIDVQQPRYNGGDDHFIKGHVSRGLGDFDLKKTLKGQLTNHDFNSVDLIGMMNNLSRHPLMTYQYTMPAQMDLYKHLMTTAHLRLLLRYIEYLDIENNVKDPAMVLRKQAQLDCLRRSGAGDIEQAFLFCVDASGKKNNAFDTLNDLRANAGYIDGEFNIIETVLTRAQSDIDSFDEVKGVLPEFIVSANRDIVYKPPLLGIKQYFVEEKRKRLGKLDELLVTYRQKREVSSIELQAFSLKSLPLTERMIRQLTLLDSQAMYIALNKVASSYANLTTADVYQKALMWLQRALNHPQLEGGYRKYIELVINDINKEWQIFQSWQDIARATHQDQGKLLEHIDEIRELLKHDIQ